jgi:hypothetical protein
VSVTHKINDQINLKTFRVINGTIENVADFNAQNPSQQESSFTQIPLEQVIAELERQ